MSFLGIDYGSKKIGLAKSAGSMAVPFRILENKGMDGSILEIKNICEAEEIKKIIVGVPVNLAGGDAGKQLQEVKKFIDKLLTLNIPVVEEDERMSTKMAKGLQKAMKNKGADDASSAAVILQAYLDRQENRN